jgi:TDG/mug DNA glycosylase family protein
VVVGTIESVWGDPRPAGRTGRAPVYYEPHDPLTPEGLPGDLARLALGVTPGTVVRCSVDVRYLDGAPPLDDLVAGAGFAVQATRRGRGRWLVDARRERTLPDFVGAGMRVLVCGLNPSVVSADAGFGFAGATNRFWTVALAAGLVTHPREPLLSLAEDRVGMTDLVKRATPNADSLSPAEYRDGAERVARLAGWLRPGVVLFVGLAGWRAAVDRRAQPGPQPAPFGGAPAYVMPSTSGRNARVSPAELATHMRRALALTTPF